VAKEAEIELKTSKLLATKRIIISSKPYYSQVHLAPEPNTEPVVYTEPVSIIEKLNEATAPISWSLPIISRLSSEPGDIGETRR